MKIIKIILIAIIVIPWLASTLGYIDHGRRMVWLIVENIFYLPLTILEEPFFRPTEIGWLATIYGKLLGTLMYSAILVIMLKLKKKL